MSECGVCKEIVTDFDEGLGCDGRCMKWYHCIIVGMPQDQYIMYCQDNSRDNKLKWSHFPKGNAYSMGQN